MVGRLLTSRLRPISLSDGFEFLRPISSIFYANFSRWQHLRYTGSRPSNKWQEKRSQEKAAIEKRSQEKAAIKKDKTLLKQQTQLYRSQQRGLLLDNATHNSNSNKSNNNSAKQGFSNRPNDKVTALANRFMKVGAIYLWNENDGPLTTDPPPLLEEATDTDKNSVGPTIKKKGTLKNSLGKRGSVIFRRGFSTGPRKYTKFDRVGTFRQDEELDDEWYGDQPFDSVRNFSEDEDEDEDAGVIRSKSNQRKGREYKRLASFSDEEEEDEDVGITSSKSKSNRGKGRKLKRLASVSDGEETVHRYRMSSSAAKSLIEDEMELNNIIDEEMTAGMKFEEDLLNGKISSEFYEKNEEAFRRSKFLRMVDSTEDFSGPRSRERSFDEDDDRREFRNPRTSRIGGYMASRWGLRSKSQSMSGFGEGLLNSSRTFSREVNEGDDKAFRRSKSSGTEEFRGQYSGPRSRQRSFDEDEGRRDYRNPKNSRARGSMSSCSVSRSKRQSMSGFDKTEEMGFRRVGPNRRGRSLSSLSGSNKEPGSDLEKETEFEQLKASRMGDVMPQYSIRKPRRESLREKKEEGDKEGGNGQPNAEDNWQKFGWRLKSETSRGMEMSEDEEEDLDKQSLPGEFCKKEQPNCNDLHTKNHWSWNRNEVDSHLSSSRFDQCNISPLSLEALSSAGYVQMTVEQEATLPIILEGKDLLAKAKTGTGKTLAFLLPAIEMVVKLPPVIRDQKRGPIVVLIVCPTRELAIQITAETNALLKYHYNIGVKAVIEGTRSCAEKSKTEDNPCQIIVATPRRLLYHIDNSPRFSNRLMGLNILVLDEADHLLELGFHNYLQKIIDAVPRQRQTVLFSATIPQEVQKISQIALRRDHAFINTVGLASPETPTKVLQRYIITSHENHFHVLYGALMEHISQESNYKVLVFCTTAELAKIFYEVLLGLNMNVLEIDSRNSQAYCYHMYDEFRNSKDLILVTSDVSAHGVDYPDVTLVVQVGIPFDRKQYIHRLGRTGHEGKRGQGLLLLAPWEEYFLIGMQNLPIKKASLAEMDLDTKSRVQHAITNVSSSVKKSAYQAWVNYYSSVRAIGQDKTKLVELSNKFSCSMGLYQPPVILTKKTKWV